jgi:hypothetical protein
MPGDQRLAVRRNASHLLADQRPATTLRLATQTETPQVSALPLPEIRWHRTPSDGGYGRTQPGSAAIDPRSFLRARRMSTGSHSCRREDEPVSGLLSRSAVRSQQVAPPCGGEAGPGRGSGLSTGPFPRSRFPNGHPTWHRHPALHKPRRVRGGCPRPAASHGVGAAAVRRSADASHS